MNAVPAQIWLFSCENDIFISRYTKLAQDRPIGKRQCLVRASNPLFPDHQYQTGGSNCEMFEITWQVFILKAVCTEKKKLIDPIN